MAAFNCENIIKQHLNRAKLSAQEILDLAAQARQLVKKEKAGRTIADLNAEVQQLTQNWKTSQQAILAAKRRNTFLNAKRATENIEFALGWQGHEMDALSALLTGSRYTREGARRSVDTIAGALKDQYFGAIDNALRRLGNEHIKFFQNGKMDEHFANALACVDNPKAYQGPQIAMEMAQAIAPIREKLRERANNAGAYIQKLDGYISSQTHDQLKIERAGFSNWSKDVENQLDWKKTAGGKYEDVSTPEARAEREDFLKHVYDNLVTGNHKTTKGIGPKTTNASGDPLIKPGNIGSTASQMSQHRILHFKSGSDWYHYNQKYGQKSVGQAIVADIEKMAGDTALMEVFGPSPQMNLRTAYDAILVELKNRKDYKGHKHAETRWKHLENRMKVLDGTLNMDGNPTLAAVGNITRAIQSMARLGMAVISGLSDMPTVAFERKWQGYGYFTSFGKLLMGIFGGRGTLAQREVLAANGVFFDAMRGQISGRFAGDVGPGIMNRIMYHYFRLNLLSGWTDIWKKSFCLQMSHDLANEAPKAWGSLRHQTRRMLSLYGIDEGKWEMLRKGQMKAADGRMYFTAELADAVSDLDIASYMKSKGMKFNKNQIAQFRDKMGDDIRAMFRDRTRYAMLEPDAETNALLTRGTAKGTIEGEALRCVMQFKQFPTLYLQRIWAREIYGRGADTIWQGLRQAVSIGSPEMSCFFGVLAMTTLFGYLSMSAKELASGLYPRNPFESWEQFKNVAIAAFAQGGGAGIYGDFLFGTSSRFGNSALVTLLGPTAGTLDNIAKLWNNIKDGQDFKSSAVRTLWSLVPGHNLFYVKGALDYFLMNQVYEALNPGFIKRLRNRVYDENQQEFWMPEPRPMYDWTINMSAEKKAQKKKEAKQKRMEKKARERARAAREAGLS